MRMLSWSFVLFGVGFCMRAHACDEASGKGFATPRFTIAAPSPHMVLVTVPTNTSLEFEREPALGHPLDNGTQRNAAQPHTRYRYRARMRATKACPAGPWSTWSRVRTPAERSGPPSAPRMLDGSAAEYAVSLQWKSDDRSADGFVLERCTSDDHCTVAALLNPDERAFKFHSLKAARYRITAFNARGYSPHSNRTALLGTDVPEKAPSDYIELAAADIHAAQSITRLATDGGVKNAMCTSPERLLAEGWTLIGVRRDEDLYKDPSGCGTGGCVYSVFSTRDGCYSTDADSAVLTTTAPFSGKDDESTGVVVTNSSGSADSGRIVIYDGTDEVDSYDWKVVDPPYAGMFPPFDTYGSLQFPEGAQVTLQPE